jgi:hypothetical protein
MPIGVGSAGLVDVVLGGVFCACDCGEPASLQRE